jgi:8-oxo-dGTP diphosphatase
MVSQLDPMTYLDLEPDAVLEHLRDDGIQRLVVGAMLVGTVEGRTQALLLTRRDDVEYGGLEELPSGGIEPGETLTEGLVREVAEETGMQMAAVREFLTYFVYESDRGRTLQLNYLVDVPSLQVIRLDDREHVDFRWVTERQLSTTNATDPVKESLLAGFRRLREP